ncbi:MULTISPECIES: GNAT family N-acetyltransferase [Pelosinus]|uniref:GCN5-related N-acetyltransferase n=1 Tax=Pelosinus fermentans B4 TaxID=1149862 RepID=I9B501_9FIRM|nr:MULTISPECIES: GNAT family N-acetyltransferase [Pelosinus]EIW20227.1 GCN5-related N-acetyltransferase [Pelosinus fermentans B4]EIW25935.1 GCN5-related N-acetyltransferase [Pelosinus fermentans A11]OAM93233.1 GCN5-related N-acetyltransferase [Pelosinus fermentans DSM 17108]SDQ71137.1 Acetyltransferase (GNAT) family protein [Pelosinus fermentans]
MADVTKIDDNSGYDIQVLNESHLAQILYLQEIIVKNLSDPTIYFAEPTQFFHKQIAIEKSVIGLFQKKQLVGFHIASFPDLNEENLGIDIGIIQEEYLQVAQVGPLAVHPDHRKRGLFSKLLAKHLQMIKEMGYKHVCATVAPDNYPSIKGFIDNGFAIRQLKIKFNNLLRYVMYLDLENCLKQPQYSVRVLGTDTESQKFMISLGFYGYDALKNENGFDIVFGRDEMIV